MEMPTPTDAHRRLQRLVGTWVGEELMFPSPWIPDGGTARGIVQNLSALDGLIVVQDYRQERDGAITFRGHGVFAYDPTKQKVVLHWFDSMGPTPNIYEGDWEGDVLTLRMQVPDGWSRATFEVGPDDRYTFGMDVGDGEQWQPMMKGTYTREE